FKLNHFNISVLPPQGAKWSLPPKWFEPSSFRWIEPQARPTLGRPVYVIESALDVVQLDGAEISAVDAMTAVVTQHETVSMRHCDFGHVLRLGRIHDDWVGGGILLH